MHSLLNEDFILRIQSAPDRRRTSTETVVGFAEVKAKLWMVRGGVQLHSPIAVLMD